MSTYHCQKHDNFQNLSDCSLLHCVTPAPIEFGDAQPLEETKSVHNIILVIVMTILVIVMTILMNVMIIMIMMLKLWRRPNR